MSADSDSTPTIDGGFPARALHRMERLGLGVRDVARLLGYRTHTPVSYHLTAVKRRPVSWQNLVHYAAILCCEPSWLARGEGAAPPPPAAPPLMLRAYGAAADLPPQGTLGERCRLARIERGLGQSEFARFLRAGGAAISRQALHKIESDEVLDPSCAVMVAIELQTGYRVAWLLTGKGGRKTERPANIDPSRLALAFEALVFADRVPQVAALPPVARAAMLAGFYEMASRGEVLSMSSAT